MGKRWSENEDLQLEYLWGEYNLQVIAHNIGRSQHAVVQRARRLKLSVSQGRLTMNEFLRKTGYSESRVRSAMRALGLCLHRVPRSDPRQKRVTAHYSIDGEQQDQIIEFLSKIPDGQPLYRDVGCRTTKGKWGVGKKPKKCVICERNDRPHYAKGHCSPCYTKMIKGRLPAAA